MGTQQDLDMKDGEKVEIVAEKSIVDRTFGSIRLDSFVCHTR